MDRVKTLLKYAVWVLAFIILSEFLINVGLNSTYRKINRKDNIEQVNIYQAEATLVNGRIRGTITNSEPEELNGKYVRIDFYSKRDVFLGRRYIEVKDLAQNGTMSFEVFFKLKYSNAPYLRRQLEQVTSQILAGMPRGDEYQRALYLHDWLCANVTYLKRGERTGQDIYEALCLRCCVCAGFSKAYAYLMQKVGIQCAVVEGDARGERHAWNRVVIGGNLYYTDVTWDRETSNRRCYEWFNLTSAQMLESHRPENPAEMPASTAFSPLGEMLSSRQVPTVMSL